MKKYKKFTLFVSLSLSCFSLSLFTLTSCSSVSKDIVNNMVNPESADKFSDKVSLGTEIKAALTDKTATDAFKGKVVDKILTHWWDSIKSDNVSVKDQDKTFNNDIDKDWDDKVSSAKSSHKHDWQYFIQNQDLNPVGGTIAKWKESQREQKIRSYFIDKVFSANYLALASKAINNADDDDLAQPVSQIPDLIDQINTYTAPEQVGSVNYKNWHNINFWPRANKGDYDDNTNNNLFLDGSYAAIQRSAFDLYTATRRPISTAMCLWKYSEAKEDTLKEWYREDSKHVTADSLSKPSYAYPFFSDSSSSTTVNDNEVFYNFMTLLKGAQTAPTTFIESGTGLNRIPYNVTNTKYTDDSSDAFLVNTDTGITDSFETYGAPIIQKYKDLNRGTATLDLPQYTLPGSGSGFNIMDAFLLDTTSLPIGPNCIDLFNVYPKETVSSVDHSQLFNKDSKWYTQNKRYLVNAYSLSITNSSGTQDAIPYILIRNDSGVHVEGIDGFSYLALSTAALTDAGDPYSQKRENQILKYRTLCENAMGDKSFSGEGIAFLKKDGTGPLKDFFSSNTNDIILNTAKKVLSTSSWKSKNILGLKDIATDSDISIIENSAFDDFISAIAQYNLFNSNLTNYDASNKKLLAFGAAYQQNYFCSFISTDNYDPKLYKNGLAIALPITFNSTSAIADNPFLTNTRYQACVDAETMIWNDAATDPIVGTGTKATRETLETQLAAKYDILFSTSIHGDTSRHEYNYSGKKNGLSENLLTNNDFINSLLWSFGSGNNFSNIEKVIALKEYLGSSNFSAYADPITSIYYSNKLFADSSELSTYNNTVLTGTDAQILSAYKSQLKQSFDKYLNVVGSSTLPYAYAQSYIDYLTLQASIKYLTIDNNKNFITWLGNKLPKPYISTNSIQPMYIAWCAKDNSIYNTTFGKAEGFNDFTFKNNYNGVLAGTASTDPKYQNTNISTPPTAAETTYTSNTNYYQFADYNGTTMFNFYGIQTADSSILPDAIKQNLFTKYQTVNANKIASADVCYGSLYGLGDFQKTTDMITHLSTINDIETFATTINNQTGGIYLNDIINAIDNDNSLSVEQAQSLLINKLTELYNGSGAKPLRDAFKPYNLTESSNSNKILNITNYTQEIIFFPIQQIQQLVVMLSLFL